MCILFFEAPLTLLCFLACSIFLETGWFASMELLTVSLSLNFDFLFVYVIFYHHVKLLLLFFVFGIPLNLIRLGWICFYKGYNCDFDFGVVYVSPDGWFCFFKNRWIVKCTLQNSWFWLYILFLCYFDIVVN